MKIKKIKKLSNNKYKIEFEDADSIVTYDNVILENNILLKKEIDHDLYMKIGNQNGYYEIYNKAVKYIVTKLRSEKEIIEYLKKYTEEVPLIDKIVKQLKYEGLLNDERYMKAFIEDKVNLTTWGPLKIKNELDKMDMDLEVVNEILDKYDEKLFKEKIKKIISKREKVNKKDSLYILKQKVERDLFDLGYPKEMIKEYTSLIDFDEEEIIKREADKVYSKLSIKYNDKTLLLKMKQKLLQKGFSIDSINEILENYKNI